MKKILVVDDEKDMLESLEKILSLRPDFNLTLESDGEKAINLLSKSDFDLIISDLTLKKLSGLDILKAALEKNAGAIVIMISGYGTIETSVQAMNLGAFDFIEKPFSSQKLFDSIDKAFEKFHVSDNTDNVLLEMEGEVEGIVFRNQQMHELIEMVKKIAPGQMNVLISGESGTGKELFARAVHKFSRRYDTPFVPVNCAALPEHLFESELFGHEQGAFTGAIKTKPGLLEFANGGTFFFDEIGDMSPALQVKLLRMLEEKSIRRVGGQKQIKIDVRIIAATNRNLEQLVEEGTFRKDLYYRLSSMHLSIPPLRERKDEIILLANYFLRQMVMQSNKKMMYFDSEAENILSAYNWPGNVREMQNIVGRAFYLCSNSTITKSDLPLARNDENFCLTGDIINLPYKDAKNLVLEKFETEYLTHHLKKYNGNISKTADSCGIDRRTIHRLIKYFNLIYKD